MLSTTGSAARKQFWQLHPGGAFDPRILSPHLFNIKQIFLFTFSKNVIWLNCSHIYHLSVSDISYYISCFFTLPQFLFFFQIKLTSNSVLYIHLLIHLQTNHNTKQRRTIIMYKPRKKSATLTYHVVIKGADRQLLFEESNDYKKYLEIIKK